jgi:hypothetical protein
VQRPLEGRPQDPQLAFPAHDRCVPSFQPVALRTDDSSRYAVIDADLPFNSSGGVGSAETVAHQRERRGPRRIRHRRRPVRAVPQR